ncbi:reverse transcriptase family protein [Imhoffiella purpurea]|uniref:RNA-directed DNA polymerase n=1 Tax=Imhoffiella purpurea TaxID=1249627 RepID=W9VA54_9GAMM|nr:reverse transcriptase family protein [Imhoffiella purpurea]EXJ13796.1 Retron-type RNA-directed DNA polymerase [Imhoffiella purpurea]
MNTLRRDIQTLAASLLAGRWALPDLTDRLQRALHWPHPPASLLAARLLRDLGEHHAPEARTLASWLLQDALLLAHLERGSDARPHIEWLLDAHVMEAQPPAMAADVPQLPTTGDLADWLRISPGELGWFSDLWCSQARASREPLRHYRYQWRHREDRPRLIEIPKPRLKRLQRRVLHEILDPPQPHPAAHGFRAGRSCLTYARPHTGQPVVARMDLRDFFQSVPIRRVTAFFRCLGYPAPVARVLRGLCTHGVSRDVLTRAGLDLPWERRQRLASPHLPQGAPTSPALANLCCYRLDCRLTGLADKLGLRYTRYADDLAFSGAESLRHGFERFHILVARIALEEGFELNTRKTRLMTAAQRQSLTGILVNAHPNLPRREYDSLKAILHNCIRTGPAAQNRAGLPDFRGHLRGRIAYLAQINPDRGARLLRLWEAIEWPDRRATDSADAETAGRRAR